MQKTQPLQNKPTPSSQRPLGKRNNANNDRATHALKETCRLEM
jgi:hypothetical protein